MIPFEFRNVSIFWLFINKIYLIFSLFAPQEAISHLQALEDELVEAHRATIQNMLKWTKEDASLLAMTNEVDYDQDGMYLDDIL